MKALEKRRPTPESARLSGLQARHAICCQSSLAADYCDFSRAEARKIWRDNAPRKLYVGDMDDAESVGLKALMRSAQVWPPKCPTCRGAGSLSDVMSGQTEQCAECSGTGKPRDARNVFHAYLRLAIRTQVLNEIRRRTGAAKDASKHAARSRHTTGNYRTGRGILRDTLETDTPPGIVRDGTHSEGGSGGADDFRVWTGSREAAAHLLPLRATSDTNRVELASPYQGVRGIDVSPLTGLYWLRPSEKLQHAYPRRALQPLELWEAYKAAYKAELKRSMRLYPDRWRNLLDESSVLVCDCVGTERCHRVVLAELIAVGGRGSYEGELVTGGGLQRLKLWTLEKCHRTFTLQPPI